MSNDSNAALAGFCFIIDRLISDVDGCKLKPDLHDLEALEMALFDLQNAKVMLLLALIGNEVAH